METSRTNFALSIAIIAILLGILGDQLLEAPTSGLNVLVVVGAVLLGGLALARQYRVSLEGGGRGMVIAVVCFAAGFAWRDSPTLKILDALALLLAAALVIMRAVSGSVRIAGIADYLACGMMSGLNALFGTFPLLMADIQWKQIPRQGWMRQAVAVARGLLIALPLLLVFGGLFMSADAVFARLVSRLFHIDMDALMTHCFLTALLAWGLAGILRATLLRDSTPVPEQAAPQWLSLGITELGLVLGLLDALFCAFVIVQVRYLFGGQAHVLTTAGLTYAQYARQGFFELVTVSVLVLMLLLFAHWLLRKDSLKTERIFHVLAGVQVMLLFVIMASALQRMRLYVQEYGLTELRLYTTAFMGWLAIVFVWFLWTVLRERRERFAFGALVSLFGMLGFLHILNPDAQIVRVNVARTNATTLLNVHETLSLSADAVPVLMERLPALPESQRVEIRERLHKRWIAPDGNDWRTWSWARMRARQAVR